MWQGLSPQSLNALHWGTLQTNWRSSSPDNSNQNRTVQDILKLLIPPSGFFCMYCNQANTLANPGVGSCTQHSLHPKTTECCTLRTQNKTWDSLLFLSKMYTTSASQKLLHVTWRRPNASLDLAYTFSRVSLGRKITVLGNISQEQLLKWLGNFSFICNQCWQSQKLSHINSEKQSERLCKRNKVNNTMRSKQEMACWKITEHPNSLYEASMLQRCHSILLSLSVKIR